MYKIPYSKPLVPDRFGLDELRAREKYIQEGMYAFVSWKWVNPLVKWINGRKCLEVMSGRGILASALRQKRVELIATDDYSWFVKDKFKEWTNLVTDVEKIDAVEAVVKYGSSVDVLIMVWPYKDNVAYQVIKTLHEVNPDAYLVYIGQEQEGVTADQYFYAHFKVIKDDSVFNKVARNYESWRGAHDKLFLGKYTALLKPTSSIN